MDQEEVPWHFLPQVIEAAAGEGGSSGSTAMLLYCCTAGEVQAAAEQGVSFTAGVTTFLC
jgi:hypothetical protein